MAHSAPNICDRGTHDSTRPALTVAEVHDIDTNEVLCVTFSCFDSQDGAWFGQVSGVRKYDLSDEDYRRLLEPVPDELVYPLAPPGITRHNSGDTNDYYIKRANLVGFEDGEVAKILPQILLEEAKTLEYLKQRHHPNLVRYYGCVLKGERIAGLALKRYHRTLLQQFECGPYEFGKSDATSCMIGLRAGVQYLHSLGLAHNDLNPANIAIDEENGVVILDFGSCRKIGEELISAGTPGWFDEESMDWAVSAKAHDEFALRKIELWLEDKCSEAVREGENVQVFKCEGVGV